MYVMIMNIKCSRLSFSVSTSQSLIIATIEKDIKLSSLEFNQTKPNTQIDCTSNTIRIVHPTFILSSSIEQLQNDNINALMRLVANIGVLYLL